MADIIASQDPTYRGIDQKWQDNGDSFARVVVASASDVTPTGTVIITHEDPPYVNNGDGIPEPVKQKWVDIGGGAYARQVIIG